MRMGFYLFAEYASMFISSAILAVLYFGAYNYPGMQWMAENVGVNTANVLYEYFISEAKKLVPVVEHGEFGADMKVSLLNDGQVTIILDSNELIKNN